MIIKSKSHCCGMAVFVALWICPWVALGQDSSLLRATYPGKRVAPTLPVVQTSASMQLAPPGQLGRPVATPGRMVQVPQPPLPGLGGGAAPNAYQPLQPTPPVVPQYGSNGFPSVTLNDASWTYQPAPPLRVFQKQDVVTIRVDEITRVMAEGNIDNRKRTLFDAVVNDWVQMINFRFIPLPMVEGEPGVAFQSQSNYRADASVESRESMTFNIAATVVDIRPNGNLVLEARKHIRINDNLWETSLTGICRGIDIGPDNVVLSKDLIDLEIRKEDQGQLRDGVSRGWFQRWVDRFGPF